MKANTILRIENITKSFPGVKALDEVTLEIYQGEVHGIVGENGAGKSTLIKILNGNYHLDSGAIYLNGEKAAITTPKKAAELGISIIFQEFNLLGNLSIAENLFLGRLTSFQKNSIWLNWNSINNLAKEYLEKVNINVPPQTLVKELSIAQKQLIELAKALTFNANIILMDEPSATLNQNEIELLLTTINNLKKEGKTIIYISHRLEEVFTICDRATVMRDGKVIKTYQVGEVTRNTLIKDMIGREISNFFPKRENTPGIEILLVKKLIRKHVPHAISFDLHKGEILGFAGLVGAGRTEIMRALFGIDYIEDAELYKDNNQIKILVPKHAIRNKFAFVTEDRKDEGLILDFSVRLNISMASLGKISKKGIRNKKKEVDLCKNYIDKLQIKTPSLSKRTLELSGGNQQKIVLSKWLSTEADILILDEPTRGIDVGTKYEIYKIINELADAGKCILLISSELPEIVGLCNRVVVLKENKVERILQGEEITAEKIMEHAVK